MRNSDELADRMARLREEWPVGSMVHDVMARIDLTAPGRARHPRRLLVGLAAGLVATMGLAWVIAVNQPKTLLAAVQDNLQKARSAHLKITAWDGQGIAYPVQQIWYRRGEGLRFEGPDRVILEDGTTQWSWSTGKEVGETVVLRQNSPGFFTTGIASKLALPDIRSDWTKFRTPDLDRAVEGRPCQGYTISLADLERLPPGALAADRQEHRALLLAEANGRIDEITLERRPKGGAWQREREIRIAYDVPVPTDKFAARFPSGARVIDCDRAFDSLYPLDRALHRVELGGLILAVHDVQPLKDREGIYVVSSVRGTAEFLKQYPPRRRPINLEITVLDVAFQRMSNGNWGAKYDVIGMGEASRQGVSYSWWVIFPRRWFEVQNGKRVYQPESDVSFTAGEPGRLDDLPGKARVPLSAVYWDEKHRDDRGVQQEVSTWAVVPLPPDRPPTTWEDVAARTRRDLLAMGVGGAGWLHGVAAETKAAGNDLRGISSYAPEAISDTEFAAAVRRGLDDLRQLDEIQKPQSERMPTP
jgi:hypothetical protein